MYQEGNYQEDEIDLFEILRILIKEKKIIISTFIIVSLLSLGMGIYEKGAKKEAKTIVSLDLNNGKFFNGEKFNKSDLLPMTVINKIYIQENIKDKNALTLDEFKNKFKIDGIIPRDILKSKDQELLNKYIPKNYDIGIRVGSIEESKNILENYYKYLNDSYMNIYASNYKFKKVNTDILLDKNYDYQDNINLLKKESIFLEKNIESKLAENFSLDSARFEYKKLEIALKNIEDINVRGLENYLEVSGVVKNINDFKIEYKNKEKKLNEQIDIEEERSFNYKKILEEYNKKQNNIIVPKGFNVKVNNIEKDNYYEQLLNEYLNSQNRIENIKTKLLILQNKNQNLQKIDEKQQKYIEKELKTMYEEYNIIVNKVNLLERKENLIKNSQLIKLIVPVEIESYLKWKLIVVIGSIVGLFMGIFLAFTKNFIGSFKKSFHILSVFFIVASVSYSSQEKAIKIQFIGDKFSEGLNLDKTQFMKDKVILDGFILKRYKLDKNEIENIKVEPISAVNSYNVVKESIVSGYKTEYFPSEYIVKINLKNKELENKIYNDIEENFQNYYKENYTNEIIEIEKVDYLKKYENYRNLIIAFNNIILGLEEEVKNSKVKENNSENKLEYDSLLLKLRNVKSTDLISVENFIKSNKLNLNIPMEKILLKGEEISLKREINFLGEKEKMYKELINDLKRNKGELILQDNGNIVLEGSRELNNKNYIKLTKEYLEVSNSKKVLQVKLKEIIENYNLMKTPSKAEKEKLLEKFKVLENSINELIVQIENIQMKQNNKEKNIIKVIKI